MNIRASARNRMLTEAEGCLGYAVDIIEFAPEHRPIFEYLLGRVVLTDSLENAIRVAKRVDGVRFVTKEGDVINAAGAMTGGAYKNRSANLLERKSEILELARRLDEISSERSGFARELSETQRSKTANMGALLEVEDASREIGLRIAALEKDILNWEGRIEELSARNSKWGDEARSMSKERERSREMAQSLEEEIENIRRTETETEEKVNLLLNDYEAEKDGLNKMNELATAMRMEAAAAESDKQNGERMLARARRGIEEINGDIEARKTDLEGLLRLEGELAAGEFDLDGVIAEKEEEKKALELRMAIIREQKSKAARLADERAKAASELNSRFEAEQSRKYETEIRRAKNDTLLGSMKDKLWDEFELSYIQAAEFRKKDFVISAAVKESREIKNRMKELGEINLGAIKEYESVSERHGMLTEQRDDLLSAIDSLRKIIADTDKNITENFRNSFEKVVANFSETFSLLFGGGKGELRLEDESRPLECGIEISAQPPGKKLQNMNLLSGGEKTMTAIALMFSILKAKPTPFCILDEVEAALDDNNINRFAEYLKNFHETQFALVTHQKTTMEFADALYGVTMPEEGISKILSLRLGTSETEDFVNRLS
jgi:chromosome segregation protein